MHDNRVSLDHIRAAARRIASYVHRTPVMSSRLINAEAGCDIHFKCENLQKVGAFKARGAHNAVLCLTPEQLARGVATHSSGNHAAALALAASHFDVPAYIVMPENAPASKVAAVRAYGGRITFCESTQAARESTLETLCERTGASFIPPYDHPDVIAGQGTAALELAEQLDPAPDFLLTPVGGGGLLAGCAIASKALMPDTAVIGAEPAGADDAMRSFNSGQWQPQTSPDTVADGLRTALGQLNFSLIRANVDAILSADDATIIHATRLVWTRMKLVIEPSAAVGLAVVLAHPRHFAGKRVAIVFSGGNVDIDKLPW
ncbi:MAG: pyridoxal-phosphate dependent enzyme [Pseudomonadales bacterium]|nr:pyridoxal-phosphate dependent enzyme [Halioglobus sp.]MCP5127967.1 pyridoxal-phosphate dependent enzyme [Pseudomonadales bacterium]